MVMLVLEDSEMKVVGVWYIHTIIEPKETIRVNGPAGVRGLGVGHMDSS